MRVFYCIDCIENKTVDFISSMWLYIEDSKCKTCKICFLSADGIYYQSNFINYDLACMYLNQINNHGFVDLSTTIFHIDTERE